jgi:glycine cleavage system H lipoate-binding protein
MDSSKKCHLIPPDEQRCLWMTAGILSYQLCDRMFDCDHCPLDAAMRRRFSTPAALREDGGAQLTPAGLQEIPQEGLEYSRNHWWVCKKDQRLVRLGIEPGLAQALLGVKGIVFPSARQRLQKGQACVWVVMEGGTLPLEAPLDGVVRDVNHELTAKPHLLSLQPLDDGWLFELGVDEPSGETAGLMAADEARPRYAADRNRFLALLSSALRGRRPAVGPTLADGGEKLQNFADMLGPTRYFALVRQSFGWTKR